MYRLVEPSKIIWIRRMATEDQHAKLLAMRVPDGEPSWILEGVLSPQPPVPQTPGEEVWALVQEWYAARGEPVPEQDRADCMKMLEEERAPKVEVVTVRKPVYGTPEFWKAHWAKKRAQATNPSAPVPQIHTAVPKAKTPPKTPSAKATAQGGAPLK